MRREEMGYISSWRKYELCHATAHEGGFSSKQEAECPAEPGPEARTHRPSLSPSQHPQFYKTLARQRGGKS